MVLDNARGREAHNVGACHSIVRFAPQPGVVGHVQYVGKAIKAQMFTPGQKTFTKQERVQECVSLLQSKTP